MIFDHLEIMHRLSQSPTEFLRWIRCLMARVRRQNWPRKNRFLQLYQVREAVDAYINQSAFDSSPTVLISLPPQAWDELVCRQTRARESGRCAGRARDRGRVPGTIPTRDRLPA